MKNIFSVLALLVAGTHYGQSVVGLYNSGALATQGYVHSVGEIYVVPEDPDYSQGSTVAIASQLLFGVLGNVEIVSEGVMFYPNPVQDYLTIILPNPADIARIEIFDMKGTKAIVPLIDNKLLDLSGLSAGTYLITLPDSNNKPIKIVKE